ncbi:MAG: hydrolase [Candidatus Limnocylindrales bacterium]
MDLVLDPARTALVLIDLQRGIVAGPTGPRAGIEVVANAAAIARAVRAAGGTVVLVHVTSSADGRDALRPVTDAQVWRGGAPAADWADLVPEVGPEPGDIVITKRQWGAFYGTELDLQLRRRGITTIVLGGISTNVGVESTARDAYERAYQQIFVEDAMAARSAEEHEHTVRTVFPRIGRVRSTADVLAALEAAGPGR